MFRGRYIIATPLDAEGHSSDLWHRIGGENKAELWRYMFDGPYPDRESFDMAMRGKASASDQRFHALLDANTGAALGYAAFLREEKAHRVIEVGNIVYSPELQRTRAATEAMYLMARHVFEDLGYRRYEWKCNALNEPSRKAALRLGFTFEGIFRQHMIVKGANRDTAWFAMLDLEWPARRAEFERWLAPSNFDENGLQETPLIQR